MAVPREDFGFGNKEEDGLVRGAGFVMILDVPRGQGLQRRFLLGDTMELLCSHTLSLPRLLKRAEPFDRLRVHKLGPYKGKTESARPRRRPLNRG